MAKNDDFGRDRSWCFTKKDLVLEYYDDITELMNERNILQEVPKFMVGAQENVVIIHQCHFVSSVYL